MKPDWTIKDIPDLTGKVVVVTGANSGLGFVIAKRLAERNATTVMACRNMDKAEGAKSAITHETRKEGSIVTMQLDTSSFESVKSFAQNFRSQHDRLDVLMCNAGVMALRERQESANGYELQFATNHLGHFLLVGELLSMLKSTQGSRVVTQSSSANWFGTFDFDDLNGERKYDRWKQYSLTKLANVTFVNELNRRVREAGLENPKGFSAHPGIVVGQLQDRAAQDSWFENLLYKIFSFLGGTYESGALPSLYACSSEDATIGEFYGPNGIFSGILAGNHPKAVNPNKLSYDSEKMQKLWSISEQMTNMRYNF